MKLEKLTKYLEELQDGLLEELKLKNPVWGKVTVSYCNIDKEWVVYFNGELDDPDEAGFDPKDIHSVAEYLDEFGLVEDLPEPPHPAFKEIDIKPDENNDPYVEGIGWDGTIYQLMPFSEKPYRVINKKGKHEYKTLPKKYAYYFDPLYDAWNEFHRKFELERYAEIAAGIKKDDLETDQDGNLKIIKYYCDELGTTFVVEHGKLSGYYCKVYTEDDFDYDSVGDHTLYREYQPIFDKMVELMGWEPIDA